MKPVFIRSPHNYDVRAASLRCGLSCPGPSLTQEHQARETDINFIMERFAKTGLMPQGIRTPTYADFAEVVDFRTAMDAVVAAKKSFMELPAKVRDRFGNDPQAFVEFCSDADNLDEMVKMGLAVKRPVPVDSPELAVLKEIRDGKSGTGVEDGGGSSSQSGSGRKGQ